MSEKSKNIILDQLYVPKLGKLIPEPDITGNIEYKLRLDKKDLDKKENMIAQMLWRMNEGRNLYGKYEAHYILGVYDDGKFSNMTEGEIQHSTNILRGIVRKANAKIISEKIYIFPNNKMVSHVIIHKDYKNRRIPESNIMILGASDVGKSSLMGHLTHGQEDDGNGFSRKLVLRHIHEKSTGITTSPKYDTIGFSDSNLINYSIGIEFTMENIYQSSEKLINLIDLPGGLKYIKTIIYCMSATIPDGIIVCIPSINTEENKTLEDFVNKNYDIYRLIITFCVLYNIKPIIVFTKRDLINNSEKKQNSEEIQNVLKLFNTWTEELSLNSDKLIKNNGECDKLDIFNIDSDSESEPEPENLLNLKKNNIICLSNITGEGYDELINVLSKYNSKVKYDKDNKTLFTFNDVFTIPDTGTIYHGTLKYGNISVDDTINILCHGNITKHKIKSIQRKTLNVDKLFPNESGSLQFYGCNNKYIDKTALIIDKKWEKYINTSIQATSYFSNVKIKMQQYLMFIGNNIVTVLLTNKNKDKNIFNITCIAEQSFLKDTNFAVLKDEQHNYFFIKLL